ncbi:MAG: P1 family peptidase [Lachnospiraceae bacterium]|nr:P1 family peptidase [Lachnospiraceae bacterium]
MKQEQIDKDISITAIDGLRIGQAKNTEGQTGVTVLLFDKPAIGGVDISGGGPASRETPLLSPLTASNPIDAIVLSGGSAYGLDAGTGVMQYLEEHGRGYETGFAKVPLVCQSCIYDLGYGSAKIRPNAALGYAACVDAEDEKEPLQGNEGAGTGAAVGKLYGMAQAEKSGIGMAAVQIGELKVAAVVVVNALGDIFCASNGEKIAGLYNQERSAYLDTVTEFIKITKPTDFYKENTTIGAVITNGKFAQDEMNKIASMTRCAYARNINPVGTMADGDTIYAVSMGDVKADINMVGTVAATVMSKAIENAIKYATISDETYLKNINKNKY